MEYCIESKSFKAVINSKGCELVSVKDKVTGREYMWDANPDAWKRHAPVLFPLVGKYKNNTVLYNNKEYNMGQHGFARDMEFELVNKSDNSIVMKLSDNKETLEKYPFPFELECGFELTDNNLKVLWKVHNTNSENMYFSIGGHPAFSAQVDSMAGSKLVFKKNGKTLDKITYGLLNEDGLVKKTDYNLQLVDGSVEISSDFFDKDAYIVENFQADEVTLLMNADNTGKGASVTVKYDAPVFGIWSAANKNVPFVCIEPWYGRADGEDFNGDITNRKWGNTLASGEIFEKQYNILFD